MSKLLNSVLDKVSENNNEYRKELRNLNNIIDEKTTSLIGDVVTLSNYAADFSNTMSTSKERLVNPIIRIIEAYVIKDLRSVETVNEQFVEKINDKLENANIETKDDRDKFIDNLNVLLNEKYLEIVKIKRVGFISDQGSNEEVESVVDEFINYLKSASNYDAGKLLNLFVTYKSEVYNFTSKTLSKISDLYLNNFVDEVSNALSGALDYDETEEKVDSSVSESYSFKPFMPKMNSVPDIDIPMMPDASVALDIPEISLESAILDEPKTPLYDETSEENEESNDSNYEEAEMMPVRPIEPIQILDEVKPSKLEVPRKSYDVEEILKIAKSPIVTMPVRETSIDEYVNIVPITEDKEQDTLDSEFNEKEIVEEMIRRLTNRLDVIDTRQSKYDEEKKQLQEDENFVNDLIESASIKKNELDAFETQLDDKDKELDKKKQELDKKLNDVLPFANAVLNSDEKES